METALGRQHLIAKSGGSSLYVGEDEPTAAYSQAAVHQVALARVGTPGLARRALVELRRVSGGVPHAVIGAQYVPGNGDLSLRVLEGSAGRMKRCQVRLGGRKLTPGMPAEFTEPALGGLTKTLVLGPGVITVDRAGYDFVETSPFVFELAAEILGRVLSLETPPTESQMRQWLQQLPTSA